MKVLGIILIVLGSLLLALSLLTMSYTHRPPDIEETVNLVAYYIGYNIFNIVGIIMIISGGLIIRRHNRRLLKKNLIDSLPGKKNNFEK